MGRRTKLTPETQDKICKAILAGNFFEVACEYAGIVAATGYQWIARGEGREPNRKKTKLYVDFVDAVRKAEREAEVQLVLKWRTTEDWHAIAEFLSRRFPDRWRAKTQQTNIDIDVSKLDDRQLERIAAGEDPLAVVADKSAS
jgi:hypothetical protein